MHFNKFSLKEAVLLLKKPTSKEAHKKSKDYATITLESQGLDFENIVEIEVASELKKKQDLKRLHNKQIARRKLHALLKFDYARVLIFLLKVALLISITLFFCKLFSSLPVKEGVELPGWIQTTQEYFNRIYGFFKGAK